MRFPDLTGWEPCRTTDPELFFPTKSDWGMARDAKRLCAGCESRDPCLQYALHHKTMGVWGGTTERERKRMQAAQRIQPKSLSVDDIVPVVRRAS